MARKIMSIILTLALTFSMYGCSSSATGQSQETSLPIPSSTAEMKNADSGDSSITVTTEAVTSTEAILPANGGDDGYTLLVVDGGDTSGNRTPMARVDVGFGDREYWAYTNEYGQLVRVTAAVVRLQDESTEPLTNGRYYPDEAKVPGTERSDLDQGHVIADSLGGVSNAYNITPQDSVLNRHGDQAYMEKVIRDAGGCTDFEAVITYPDTKTQIPSHYDYTYTVKGNVIHDSFDNVNPDEANKALNSVEQPPTQAAPEAPASIPPAAAQAGDISAIDTNGNGQVSIKEAKAAGFKMPITRDHWLYPYMTDGDGDGMVGE